MFEEIINKFSVSIYGALEKYSDTISKGRCRIFYKELNRNGTYITNEFAEKLISTIAYAPIKGIYDSEEVDYTDHGEKRSQGRIYGVVPENPNFAWEKHLDEDGIEREYACVDVLIYTALYQEATQVFGKSQSMEIYPPSIKGNWEIKDGKRVFVYTDGAFLGLQILGDETEPCFEGAAFYSLYNEFKELMTQLEKFNKKTQNGGENKMPNYKLSDNAKYMALWSLLNVNYSEANGWIIDCDICEIYDQYAIVRNHTEGKYERIYYAKDDETDSLSITSREECFIVDVTATEKQSLEALQKLNGDTYEKVDEVFAANAASAEVVKELEEKNSNFEMKIGELETSISTLTTERDEAKTTLASLQEQNEALSSFKAEVEKKEKEQVLSKYEDLLDSDVVNSFSERLDEFTAQDLDKELAYALVSSNTSVFTKGANTGLIPKTEEPISGLNALLDKYKRD